LQRKRLHLIFTSCFSNTEDLSSTDRLLDYAVWKDVADYLEVLVFILDKHPPIQQLMFANHATSYKLQKALGIGTRLHVDVELGKLDMVDAFLPGELISSSRCKGRISY
jgi:hypothetical protein